MKDRELRDLRRWLETIPRGRGYRIPRQLHERITAWVALHRERGCRKRAMAIAENGRWRSPKTYDGDRRKRRRRSLVGPIAERLGVAATA
jgi:hypothetical protein